MRSVPVFGLPRGSRSRPKPRGESGRFFREGKSQVPGAGKGRAGWVRRSRRDALTKLRRSLASRGGEKSGHTARCPSIQEGPRKARAGPFGLFERGGDRPRLKPENEVRTGVREPRWDERASSFLSRLWVRFPEERSGEAESNWEAEARIQTLRVSSKSDSFRAAKNPAKSLSETG